LPATLAVTSADFIVRAVDTSAYATRYTLERAADGSQVNVEIAGRGVRHSAVAQGTRVVALRVSTGVVLAVSGNAIALVPNALGRALLRGERIG
jgi:20S proteasome alpha/beta subunit